jgi:hypothetical protein
VYSRDVLGGKSPPSPAAAAALAAGLLVHCSTEDFAALLQPPLDKLLRKNPDSVLPAVCSLLSGATALDLR